MILNSDLLVESLADAVLALDKHGVIISSNHAVTTLTGFEKSELLGKRLDIFSSDKNDYLKYDYELGLVDRQGSLVSEGWKVRKDGGPYWAHFTMSVIRDHEGERAGYACILRDTSAMKQAEIQLRKQEERYRLLVEAVKDYAIFMLDPEGHIATWNDGGRNLNGYTAEEIIGKHFSIFYTADDLAKRKPAIELETARMNGRYEEEGWRVRKNGSLYWARIVVTAILNQNNELIGFSKVTFDLTDKLREEELLRQSEERYRFLVEQVGDYAIFMLDERGKIVSWNEGAKRIKGYTAPEIIGKYFSIFYPEEEIIKGKPTMELTVARSVGKYEEEGWRLRKDGTRFWANVVITAVYNNEKNLIGFAKVTRDLTERKLVEHEIRETSEKYRQMAQEMELINKRLSASKYELEQFNSVVSHDLQEPLRTMKSYLYLIDKGLEKIGDEQLKAYVGKSTHAADRMKNLISALLSYSQITNVTGAFEDLQVSDLVEKALHDLKGTIDETDAEISLDIQVAVVKGDSIQLTQLFQNLIGNALKFVDGRRPVISIGATNLGSLARFSVTDNGIGLDEDSREKIFEVFRRLHTSIGYPGTGIGLAICKKVVERHEGAIWVESEPGVGSTFYFTLPLRAERS